MRTLDDVQPGMVLEGVVTNVTKFGAFVDIGVHQDGLVHISELSNRFIKEPSEAVKAGQIVKVKVLSIDAKAKRIGLSIKALTAPAGRPAPKKQGTLLCSASPAPTLDDKLAVTVNEVADARLKYSTVLCMCSISALRKVQSETILSGCRHRGGRPRQRAATACRRAYR